MQIKEVQPINFLFYRVETKIADLGQHGLVGQELIAEAVKNKLTVTGPVHWHYFGFEGDYSKPFTLEVSLPVGEVLEEYDGKFHFKRTEKFKSLSVIHEGPWNEIPRAYEKLVHYIMENKLQAVAANREIYVNMDFKNPEANTTEIQMGIL